MAKSFPGRILSSLFLLLVFFFSCGRDSGSVPHPATGEQSREKTAEETPDAETGTRKEEPPVPADMPPEKKARRKSKCELVDF